jgi:4-hydroxy-2-oxoheptanedioate aldolase
MDSRLHRVWSEGKGALNGWLSIPSTVTAEILAMQDFDSLTVDLQHGLVDYQTALTLFQAVQGWGRTPMARVPWNEPGIIMKLLDAGALGIICPMINTPEDAERFVGACLYHPAGYRSTGPTRAGLIYPDYFKHANGTIVSMAMIETVQAVENADAICSTKGLSGIYVGPSDLAVSMGKGPGIDPTDPAVIANIDKALAAAKKAGIKAGIHCLAPSYCRQMIDKGFDFVTLGSDVRMFTASASGDVKAYRDLEAGR